MEEWIKLRLELINLFLDEEDKVRRNTIILQLKQIIEKYEN
tara:strand:+ start:1274 stop:1396 length:123 start_codon:yes stop_codon:yes gene_type:complete